MAIRPPLNHKPTPPAAPEPKAVEPEPAAEPRGRGAAYRSPSRVGKRAAVAWLEPEAVKQLNLVAIQRDIHVQDILVEAVNDWFARHGLPRFDA
jgi:hypothetical protein